MSAKKAPPAVQALARFLVLLVVIAVFCVALGYVPILVFAALSVALLVWAFRAKPSA